MWEGKGSGRRQRGGRDGRICRMRWADLFPPAKEEGRVGREKVL